MPKFRILPHGRLQEWVAEEHGYFREEGLDYEFDPDGFAGASTTTGSSVQPGDVAPMAARSGAFEDMEAGRACDVSGACHWAVNMAATASHGKMWGHAYSVSESGIFVAPDSRYPPPGGPGRGEGRRRLSLRQPLLGDPGPLAVLRARPDPAALRRPPLRPRAPARRGEIEAANVFGVQYYILEQLGFRKLVDTTFMMGFMVAEDADTDDLERYFRALRHAQREIDLEPERYKHFWAREMPEDLLENVDIRRFGPGERIVFEPYTRDMFERTHRWMRSWQLLDAESVARSAYEDAVLA